MNGTIFNIQKFSLHDGPGIRTLVFFKGCPLSCKWCSNPEGMNARPEVAYMARSCLGAEKCGVCLKSCPFGAVKVSEKGAIETDHSRCIACGHCLKPCPTKSRVKYGDNMTVEEILKMVEEDNAFYTGSGGGISLSGGEPLLQAGFAAELLRSARKRGLNTALESTGYAPWQALAEVALETDFIHFDIKHIDNERHIQGTGVSNHRILENFHKLCQEMPEKKILVRTPVIPGFNDEKETLQAIARLVRKAMPGAGYELLAYHTYGESKYQSLDRVFPMAGVPSLGEAEFKELQGSVQEIMNRETIPILSGQVY